MADPRDFARPDTSQQFRPDRAEQIRPNATPPSVTPVPGINPDFSATDQGLKGLGTLMPELNQFIDRKDRENSEAEIQAGRQKQLELAMDSAEAVRQGKLAPNQSKWFMKGYKAQYGELLGDQWALEAKTAWMGGEAKNSDDPTAAATFLRDFTAKKLGSAAGMDPDVRAGLLPRLANMHSAIMSAQAEYSSQQVYEKNLEIVGQLIAGEIDTFINAHGNMSMEELFTRVKSRDAAGRLQGVKNDDLNKAVVQAVISKARETGSTSLLNILKKYPTVGNNPKYLDTIRSAADAIESKALARASHAMAIEARNIRVAGQRAFATVFDTLLKQREQGIRPHLTAENIDLLKKSGDAETGVKALKLMEDQGSEFDKPRPQEMVAMYKALAAAPEGRRYSEVEVLIDSGLVRDRETARLALGIAKQLDDEKIQSHSAYTEGTSRIQRLADQTAMGPTQIDPTAVNEATSAFQRDFTIWMATHPGATNVEVDKQKNDLIDKYLQQLSPYKLMEGGQAYKRGTIQPEADKPQQGGQQNLKTLTDEQLLQMLNTPQQK